MRTTRARSMRGRCGDDGAFARKSNSRSGGEVNYAFPGPHFFGRGLVLGSKGVDGRIVECRGSELFRVAFFAAAFFAAARFTATINGRPCLAAAAAEKPADMG